jgi:hypothetical protein
MAHEGLDSLGVDGAIRDRLLGIIEQRCLKHVNGATWQVDRVHGLERAGAGDRFVALRGMVLAYEQLMHSNTPVHEWEP